VAEGLDLEAPDLIVALDLEALDLEALDLEALALEALAFFVAARGGIDLAAGSRFFGAHGGGGFRIGFQFGLQSAGDFGHDPGILTGHDRRQRI